MRISYARVSTDDQTLDLQRDALKRAKCRHTYGEHASGKNTARPELDGCLKALRKGDTLGRVAALGQMAPGDTTVGFTPTDKPRLKGSRQKTDNKAR